MSKKIDFSGYATKFNIKCSDGRTILPSAFEHQDGAILPLVWQHMHNDPTNVLGHALLETRDDGVYAYCSFNETPSGKNAKVLVQHGDIEALSIHANQLKQKGDAVLHGMIRELSLVLSGANPGARIDNVSFSHADGYIEYDEEEALIFHDDGSLDIHEDDENDEDENDDDENDDEGDEKMTHSDSGKTVEDVFNTLNEEQKNVVYAMLASVIEDDSMSQSEGGSDMKTNVFENGKPAKKELTLTHGDLKTIVETAQKCGSFKDAFLQHTQTYGIENIDFLFPDAKTLRNSPDMIDRRQDWVPVVKDGAKKSPFSRIKSIAADITAEEARAKGYVKGNLKKEEVVKLLKRVTTPTTIYKKQKLDRDDIIDITDLDVVAWLKTEMRGKLDEEIARAALLGDGRAVDHEDKINEENIRPIYKDDVMYSHKVQLASNTDTVALIEAIIRSHDTYEGSGSPDLFIEKSVLTDMLLLKDTTGRKLYSNKTELANELMVSNIVPVAVMTGVSREGAGNAVYNLKAIMVNMKDYTMGADKGGEVSMFDDFDIDYNQYKYLIEGRMSGCLTKPKSAIVFEKAAV